VAVVLTLVQTKQIRMNIHKRNTVQSTQYSTVHSTVQYTVQTVQNTVKTSTRITKTPTQLSKHPHIHNHTLQNKTTTVQDTHQMK